MNEARLREIMAEALSDAKHTVRPEEITDTTCIGFPASYDSHAVMMIVMGIETEADFTFSDAEVSTLTSWPNVKAAVAAHEKGAEAPFYKALVLDADGTLWGGILGEGGITKEPAYVEAQKVYLSLQQRGVLLCLASKNEKEELQEALSLGGMPLRPEHFTVIRDGWGNKVASLKAIAKQLKISLDSIVFVDDSPFECEYVRAQLPMVKVVQVPAKLADYPRVSREVAALFPTMVDTSKTTQYRALAAAEATRPQFASEEDYLASLDIEVEIHCNRRDEIERIAELTQKSNQFNLTTIRYAPEVIESLMDLNHIYTLTVRDKFGDQGLCGVLITKGSTVEAFLLSCRVLGRGIEFSPWQMLGFLGALTACYIPTAKNGQVEDFWDRVGLFRANKGPMNIQGYMGEATVKCPPWIKVTYAV